MKCRTQLAVWEMEGRLGVALPFRFPLFKALMWHAASHYAARLQAVLAAGMRGVKAHTQASTTDYCF